MILEIGTGLKKDYAPFLNGKNVIHLDISKSAQHIEMNSDVRFLPFKDKVFDFVYASHVLEHCHCPLLMLEEMKRVCKKKIIIKVPHYQMNMFENEGHIFSWSVSTISNLFKIVFPIFKVYDVPRIPDLEVYRKYGRLKRIFYKIVWWIMHFKGYGEILVECKL